MSTDYSTDFMLVYEEELDNAKKKSSGESSINDKWRAKFMVNLRKNGLELEEVTCIHIVIIFPINDEKNVLIVQLIASSMFCTWPVVNAVIPYCCVVYGLPGCYRLAGICGHCPKVLSIPCMPAR